MGSYSRQLRDYRFGRKASLCCAILCLLVSAFTAWAQETGKCQVCGMHLAKYLHTRYVVSTTDGRELGTCGVQCGLTLHLRLKDKWKSAVASDFITNRALDATKGYFVYKSSVVPDMSPGFTAFALKTNAEKFAQGFGGQVLTYDEALDEWRKKMN